MPNGLKVVIKQGDLVNEIMEVIANPANPDLQHVEYAAKAIAMAAGSSLLHQSEQYITRLGLCKPVKSFIQLQIIFVQQLNMCFTLWDQTLARSEIDKTASI